jgi:hypothetical protein
MSNKIRPTLSDEFGQQSVAQLVRYNFVEVNKMAGAIK